MSDNGQPCAAQREKGSFTQPNCLVERPREKNGSLAQPVWVNNKMVLEKEWQPCAAFMLKWTIWLLPSLFRDIVAWWAVFTVAAVGLPSLGGSAVMWRSSLTGAE